MAECQCNPPGSGAAYCTGHCVLRARIARLETEVGYATSQIRGLVDRLGMRDVEIRRLRALVISQQAEPAPLEPEPFPARLAEARAKWWTDRREPLPGQDA